MADDKKKAPAKKAEASKADKPKAEKAKKAPKREVATEVVSVPETAVDAVQNKLVASREYGEAGRRATIAGNHEKRRLQQESRARAGNS